MNYDKNIYAEVVFDGVETHAPKRMGEPKPGQLQGTTFERLAELAGRVCYDSLGKGRDSAAYHQHIAEVGHGSVLEHANFTIEFRSTDRPHFYEEVMWEFLNRPGVWVNLVNEALLSAGRCVRVTVNLRAVVEWDDHEGACRHEFLRAAVFDCANQVAPVIFPATLRPSREAFDLVSGAIDYELVTPEHLEEKWVSLLLGGSRGFSHEQVRHKFRTAVSQRSTRFVDESESPWVVHPLETVFEEWLQDQPVKPLLESLSELPTPGMFEAARSNVLIAARHLYERRVGWFQRFLLEQNVDKHTARKQARGAARGYLGNALHTEMIFSASVAQWRRMFAQRCTVHADAEIRVLFNRILPVLKTTRWADDFADLTLVPSPDGIGEVIG